MLRNLTAAVLLTAGFATAQPIQARFILGGTSYADEGAVNHFTTGAGVRFYISKHWSIEPEYLYSRTGNRHHDQLLWGNFTFDFRDRDEKTVPYWFASPGLVRNTDKFGPAAFSSTEGAFGTGAGARLFLSDRVFVAPQFRVGIANGLFGEITGSIGFVVRR